MTEERAEKSTPKQADIKQRRSKVSEMYLSGVRQEKIAAVLNVDQATISRDLKALQADWVESSLRDISIARAEELRKIDRIEREYWAAWRRSKKKAKSTSKKIVKTPGVGKDAELIRQRNEATEREEERLGDPRYLAGIQWCIEQRTKIIGFSAATKSLNIDMTKLTEAQLRRLAAGEDVISVLSNPGDGGVRTEEPGSDGSADYDLET